MIKYAYLDWRFVIGCHVAMEMYFCKIRMLSFILIHVMVAVCF